MIDRIINAVKSQIEGLDNLQFYAYWVDNFIAKNKETGEEIMTHLRVKNIDTLYAKLKV